MRNPKCGSPQRGRDSIHNRLYDQKAKNGETATDDTRGERVDQHLKASLDPISEHTVKLLNQIATKRPHDHSTDKHRLRGADRHARRRNGTDDRAAVAMHEATTRKANQNWNQERYKRRYEFIKLRVWRPSGRNKKCRNQAPCNKRRNVWHDHAGEKAAKLLHARTGLASLSDVLNHCLTCHV